MTRRILASSDAAMCSHQAGRGHPERPARLETLQELVKRLENEDLIERRTAQPTERKSIGRVHTEAHVDFILGNRGKDVRIDIDTGMSAGSVDAALLAAGASVASVDALLDDQANATFALVRPPGHHAESNRAMGFCLFNNIAIAAAHAIEARGIERVMIIDWDVHHGNGTQEIFYSRRDVFYASIHQWPFYPGTGAIDEVGSDRGGFTLNVPLPAGCGDDAYAAVYERVIAPAASAYQPQLLLVSAGFDAHEDDPLAGMRVTTAGFGDMAARVLAIANECTDGRVGFILEGGYDLAALEDSMERVIRTVASGDKVKCRRTDTAAPDSVRAVIRELEREHPLLQG